jgi:hypothetical protein
MTSIAKLKDRARRYEQKEDWRAAIEVYRKVLEAEEVRVVAPMLTSRLQSWVSDIDAAAGEADERMNAIVGSIGAACPASRSGTDPFAQTC